MAKKFDFLSPGIEIREIDQSFIPAQVDAEGPIIIGRTRKGPANKPVKVSNLDDFVSVFGLPVAGGNGVQGDMWRDGNMAGPTYASYAAQSWLASEQSPITIVRLAGEQHDDATDAGKAGWELAGSASSDFADNSTAYGLFLFTSSSANTDLTGALGAVFYCDSGYLALSGTNWDGDVKEEAGTFMQSLADNEFKLSIYNASNQKQGDSLTFSFNRNSSTYIRSVFNTNPQLINDETVPAAQLKTYWLGETFNREVEALDLSTGAGESYAALLPLASGSAGANQVNWGDHREGAREGKSGWIISQKEKGQSELLKFKSLHVGNEIEKSYMIAIEQIAEPANPTVNAYGTFTVCVKSLSGEAIERYSGCNLNPSSPDYVARRIGDQFIEWSDTDRRYRTYGDFPNQSDLIYVEVKQFVKDGGAQGHLPAGFVGPVRPKGFNLVSGSADAKEFGSTTTSFAGAFVQGSGSVPATADENMFAFGPTDYTASVNFPAIPLRQNGIEGGAPNPYRAYYGIRPKISTTSNQNDTDYVDYLRVLSSGIGTTRDAAAGDFENSFVFTLDDLVIATGSNDVTYTSGSNNGDGTGTAFTDVSGTFGELLDLGVRQFLLPLQGGFDGFDITEKEPFRVIPETRNDKTSYVHYTLNKALDAVLDSEVVPANLLLMPGIRKPVITNRIIDVAESRKDVLAIIDLEGDYTPSAERLDDAEETASLGSVTDAVSKLRNRNLNSSYACAFYPWVQISDNLNNSQLVWIPPSVAALGAFGRSQAQSDVWFAPAGFNRGGLGNLGGSRGPRVTQARQRLDSAERDSLYEVGINPIATFPAEGVVIFGQKTLQADQSALDRINVRRLVLHLKAQVSKVARNLLFDQNVESTWNRFKSQVKPILSDARARFGLSDYKLILDSTTTTADLVDRNIMYAKIYIKPARAIEYIVVDFVITKTGADFV